MSNIPLFNEFSAVSAKEWKQKIQSDLKGADYNETLVWESPEGIKVKPFYHSDDAVSTSKKLTSKDVWKVGQSLYAGNATLANEKALKVIKRGAESLLFTIPSEKIEISKLLSNIEINNIPVYLNMEFLSQTYIQSIFDLVGQNNENIYLNVDVIGHLSKTGNWYSNLEKDFAIQENILNGNFKNVLSVDSSLYQNAGADMVQQLAYSLAHANEYLNLFSNKEKQAFNITFKVSIGTNYFFEIAKIRALRLLWKTVAAEYNVATDCHIIATPTKRNKTLYDYNTNMLRTTTECMAAVLGGADTIVNLPYDTVYHKENDFGERIAINQLLLLKNESYFDKVVNPADGAYYLESITNQLAEKALELFQSVESEGGFLKQLQENTIQIKIEDSAENETLRFKEGREVLVGTNKYVNENDLMKNSIELHPFLKTKVRKTLIQPILEKRLAEDVEQKRLDDE